MLTCYFESIIKRSFDFYDDIVYFELLSAHIRARYI